MTLNRHRFRLAAWLFACVASVGARERRSCAAAQAGRPRRRRHQAAVALARAVALAVVVRAAVVRAAVRVAQVAVPAPSPTFTMRVCNKANDIDMMFVAIVTVVGQQFRAQGWAQVPRGQCGSVGTFNRPTIWWHVRASNGVAWQNKNERVELCVNLNGGFDYTWGGENRPCTQGETGVPFYKIEIPREHAHLRSELRLAGSSAPGMRQTKRPFSR